MQRSHSRHSYPFDKLIPRMPKKKKVTRTIVRRGVIIQEFSIYEGYDSNQRQLYKRMHKKKQREHNRRISEEGLYEEKETETNVAEGNLES